MHFLKHIVILSSSRLACFLRDSHGHAPPLFVACLATLICWKLPVPKNSAQIQPSHVLLDFEPRVARLRYGVAIGPAFERGPWFHNAQICSLATLLRSKNLFVPRWGQSLVLEIVLHYWLWTQDVSWELAGLGAQKIQSKRRLWPCRLQCHRPASHPNGVQHDTALMTFCKLI